VLDQFGALVSARNRLCRVATHVREIVRLMHASGGAQGGEHILGDLAFIEPGPPFARDAAQHLG